MSWPSALEIYGIVQRFALVFVWSIAGSLGNQSLLEPYSSHTLWWRKHANEELDAIMAFTLAGDAKYWTNRIARFKGLAFHIRLPQPLWRIITCSACRVVSTPLWRFRDSPKDLLIGLHHIRLFWDQFIRCIDSYMSRGVRSVLHRIHSVSRAKTKMNVIRSCIGPFSYLLGGTYASCRQNVPFQGSRIQVQINWLHQLMDMQAPRPIAVICMA